MGDTFGLSGAASGALNLIAQNNTNQANKDIASEANAFSERMSSSAYQRASADMKKAGINPIMAYSQGGASAPQGQTATMESGRPGDIADKYISTAMDKKRLDAEVAAQGADTLAKSAMAATEVHRADRERWSAKQAKADYIRSGGAKSAETEGRVKQEAMKTDEDNSTLTNITRKIGENLGNLNPFKGMFK